MPLYCAFVLVFLGLSVPFLLVFCPLQPVFPCGVVFLLSLLLFLPLALSFVRCLVFFPLCLLLSLPLALSFTLSLSYVFPCFVFSSLYAFVVFVTLSLCCLLFAFCLVFPLSWIGSARRSTANLSFCDVSLPYLCVCVFAVVVVVAVVFLSCLTFSFLF